MYSSPFGRRRAKTLNFSIAYGKTIFGLSKDWGVTRDEAKAMLDAWYADRPEVLKWQRETIARAHRTGNTRTLIGRYRNLDGIFDGNRALVSHLERAAINTPIQVKEGPRTFYGLLTYAFSHLLPTPASSHRAAPPTS